MNGRRCLPGMIAHRCTVHVDIHIDRSMSHTPQGDQLRLCINCSPSVSVPFVELAKVRAVSPVHSGVLQIRVDVPVVVIPVHTHDPTATLKKNSRLNDALVALRVGKLTLGGGRSSVMPSSSSQQKAQHLPDVAITKSTFFSIFFQQYLEFPPPP